MKMSGNTILITGGSSGIGLEFAKQFVQLGNQVIVTGRNLEKLEAVRKNFPQIHVLKSDVTRVDDIKELFEQVSQQFPALNILVNNAGVGRILNLMNCQDITSLNEELDTNLRAPIQMINQFLPLLSRQIEAAIINVTSALAFVPFPKVPIYSAAKAGLHSYSLSLRMQLRSTAIRIFEVAPPTTQTDMLDGFGVGDLRGIEIMSVADMVAFSLLGIKNNQFEICPGQAKQLKLMGRLAPDFVLQQMSRSLKF
jgi:uncharacterized oxidoreductase